MCDMCDSKLISSPPWLGELSFDISASGPGGPDCLWSLALGVTDESAWPPLYSAGRLIFPFCFLCETLEDIFLYL